MDDTRYWLSLVGVQLRLYGWPKTLQGMLSLNAMAFASYTFPDGLGR